MKDEREILTRQIILKKLVYEAKRSMVGALLICILGAIVLGMMHLSLLFFHYVSFTTKLISSILSVIYFIVCAFFFIRAILKMIKAKKGDFTVIEDVLIEINDNQLSIIQLILYGGIYTLFGDRSHLNHVFKFKSGKIFTANAEEYKSTRLGTVAEFSLPGDTFFLVSYNSSPDKIILLFSSKIYNYKAERNNFSPR